MHYNGSMMGGVLLSESADVFQALSASACLRASVCAAQAHMHASSLFDENVESMSVKLTMKRMQGYLPPRKAGKLNMALVSRLKLLGKAAKACWLLLARIIMTAFDGVPGLLPDIQQVKIVHQYIGVKEVRLLTELSVRVCEQGHLFSCKA